ncbi:MAG: hypothetical protein ACN6O5_16415 [Achromobacter sp.]|uniref:hypothetical protein n=1 Tax=Achromobacter sp. TaxID=134375 RepID=UPI003D070817
MSFLKKWAVRQYLVCAAIALALVVAVFPDVIFEGASLRMTDHMAAEFYGGKQLRPFYPTPEHVKWWGGYNDTGGAVFQSEPMVEFMRRAIETGDSPYWNPYAAGGALGPESLVDMKFSVPTIVTALTGGSSLSYNVSALIYFVLGTYFLILTMIRVFELSKTAAVGAAVFFLLNGYAVANLGSNVAQSYPFIPICLYAVLMHAKSPGALRFIAVCLTFALTLSCTFAPTTIVSIIGVYVVVLAYLGNRVAGREISFKAALYTVFLQAFAGVVAMSILAFIYLPVIENLENTAMLKNYVARVYFPAVFPAGIAALFSPSLFFESYNLREPAAAIRHLFVNTVYHFGLVAAVLAACAVGRDKGRFRVVALVCSVAVLFFLGNIYGIPIVRPTVAALPIIGSIGNQYWWMSIVVPLIVLVGLGLDNILAGKARLLPALAVLGVAIASAVYLWQVYGLGEPNLEFKKAALLWTGALLVAIVVGLWCARFAKARLVLRALAAVFVACMFVELVASSKMVRYERNDFFENPTEAIAFLKKYAGDYRTANFGTTGLYPDLGSAFGIHEVSSTNEGNLPYFRDYFYSAFDLDPSQQFGYSPRIKRGPFPTLFSIQDAPEKTKIDWAAVDLLGIKYIMVPSSYLNWRKAFLERGLRLVYESPGSSIFENPSVMSRAFLVPRTESGQNADIKLNDDYRSSAKAVEIVRYRNAEVVLAGTATEPGLAVFTDNWHPNWTATVNGKPAQVIRADGIFRGVAVPAGDFRIEMEYRPKTLSLALYLGLASLALLVLIFAFRKRIDRFIRGLGLPVSEKREMDGVRS